MKASHTDRRITRRSILAAGAAAVAGCARTKARNTGSAAATDAVFHDVTARAGIDYRWQVTGPRPLTILETIGNGCAFLDFDGDGLLDILLVGPEPALYRNLGGGRFADVSHETGIAALRGRFLGCAVGDYDNDGYPDIYLTGYRDGVLLHNEGGKRFADVSRAAGIPPQPWGSSAIFVDVTGNGSLDLYVGNYCRFGPNTMPQLCRQQGSMTACGPRYYQPEKGRLYINRGGGRFADATAAWGAMAVSGKALGIAAADYSGAGRQSLAIANDEMPGDLLRNIGGAFRNDGAASGTAYDTLGQVHAGMGIDWGDYDNDGRLDLLVTTFQHEPKNLYHNDGDGVFTDRSAPLGIAAATAPWVSFGCKLFDYDNDGWLDMVICSGHISDNIAEIDPSTTYRQRSQLFHNEGGTAFREVRDQSGDGLERPIVGRGLAVGDYDNDGRLDLLIVDSEGAPLLLHNDLPTAGNWLLLHLEGRRSNRDGQGALVTFTTKSGRFLRNATTGGSYMSASDPRVHCGLGRETTADIAIIWPSGVRQKLAGVKANQILRVQEAAES
ncbi:MAG: CRTAC1 family protein [Armatimonadetes bacterium]|nr:CRTAC1 family protein [Armatimonadota bacterium]MDE2205812.1 CRTAC1 family protein [Armatimonadota bacterium]